MKQNEPVSSAYQEPKLPPDTTGRRLTGDLAEDMVQIRAYCQNTNDLLERRIRVSGVKAALLMCEGMVNTAVFIESMAEPLMALEIPDCTGPRLAQWVSEKAVFSGDQKEFFTYDELFRFMMAGFVILLIDGVAHGVACGIQGFAYRSVSEPSGERNVHGSREGLVEAIRINQAMIRRRIKSPTLKFEMLQVGKKSRTDVFLVYLTDTAKPQMLQQLRRRLMQVGEDLVLGAGYLEPYLEGRPWSLFPSVGITERPDTVCAKINEGRVAVLVDGVPFALVVPFLFHEHFQSMDDYVSRPYYAAFLRLLKYGAFLVSFLLPGLYVAMAVFHPEMIPDALLYNIVSSEQSTPFSMMTEALIIQLIYEMMREAGLRLPQAVGHAVSIVGALVIGDAAVSAGLIGSPMVLIVALTAISAFVVPSLYEASAVLKFVFILAGGCWGLYGIAVVFIVVLGNLCALQSFGVPVTAPVSPFLREGMRDVFTREGWKKLARYRLHVQNLPGSRLARKEGGEARGDGNEGR